MWKELLLFYMTCISFALLISRVDASKKGTNITLPMPLKMTELSISLSLVHRSYYCRELCSVHIPCHSVKIHNLEPLVLVKVLKYGQYFVKQY